ncbi:MAG: ABC transporter permease subunit [Lachnospiraceae bacterium]|jgi:ABC-2 type transport system permease protein|nr:ABC transporter permease subunit [Lachnospiraceae bacterium]
MRNLLSADFARLWRSRLFWIMEAGVFAWGIFVYFLLRVNTANGYPFQNGNNYFFNYMTFVGITVACFSGLFIGTEYSDGTMRNKISVGHSRVTIYLANLVTVACAGVAQSAAYTLAALTAGPLLVGDLVWSRLYSLPETFALAFLSICSSAAVAVLVSMVVLDKSKAVLLNALLSIVLLAAGASALKGLLQPPMTERAYVAARGQYVYASQEEIGDLPGVELAPNPKYLNGTERKVYECIAAVLPTSLALSCALDEGDEDYYDRFSGLQAAGALAAVALLSGSGILVFRKRDLK